MNSAPILSNINEHVQLDENEAAYLESVLISRPFKQDELIVKSGDIARYIMFVNAGYIMSYYTDQEGDDHVVQFAAQNWWSGDLFSLSQDPRTIYSTKGLTDGELLLLPRSAQDQLFEKYPKFERYFRITFQTSLIRQQLRFIESYSLTAEERYVKFQLRFPKIDQYIAQKYIASYLGITPEFLSKIRKRLLQGKS
ncbi:MAG: cAMP-binding domain of or a regulatory subunit of cAMP-dependent protein kinase [Mucilaginibacter sp.]|nr:cAMP-binding domain of or a regulatory subunit of cAMP-dependent protein kinase [Mucilaginibacter sp.]